MKKWNKHDTKFILRSVAISSFAIFIWSLFYTYQINENYLNISLTHEEAKEEAIQYLKSRGWDISGYTYAINYTKEGGSWGHNTSYLFEVPANNDKEKIDEITKLAAYHRWNMRWFKPPQKEEFQVSYTKDGSLTYFEHFIAETLAGDSLPQDIAFNMAKMFLKNMPSSDFVEDDWIIKQKKIENKPNRVDHYFQWEHKKYKFENSTIRMSIRVRGSEVVRYHRWLDENEKFRLQYTNWGNIANFHEDLDEGIFQIFAFISMLFALFYFKIPGNWKLGTYAALFIVCVKIIQEALQIPTRMMNFNSEDSILASTVSELLPTVLFSCFIGFIIILFTTTIDKLYKKVFPHFISIKYVFHPKGLTSKRFFNNYVVGLVAGLCTVTLGAIFYYFVHASGNYIAYQYLDFNSLLSANPLIHILATNIFLSWMAVIGLSLVFLAIYHTTNAKWLSIVIVSIIFSINPFYYTDPIFIGSIFKFIMGFIGCILLFRFGILSLAIYAITFFLIPDVILLLFTNQIYNIITGIILILLLISLPLYSILHYLKYKVTTNTDSLLNSAESFPEVVTSTPETPNLEPLVHTKWAYVLFIIGLFCIFIPNNDELQDAFKLTISRDDAIASARDIITNDFGEDISEYKVSTDVWSHLGGWWNWSSSAPPLHFNMSKRNGQLAYLKKNVGRKGILELQEKHKRPFSTWVVKFYKPNSKESYRLKINHHDKNNLVQYNHRLSETMSLPSLSKLEAETTVLQFLDKQNIDTENLEFIGHTDAKKIGHQINTFDYDKEIVFDNGFTINNRMSAGVFGNLFGHYNDWFWTPESWDREYGAYGILFLLCTWGGFILWIVSMIIAVYYLIYNTQETRYEISWKLIAGMTILISFLCITDKINDIPRDILNGYWGNTSWVGFWLTETSDVLTSIAMLFMYMVGPICALYFVNPSIKNVFSSNSRKQFGSGALISVIAATSAMLLYSPIKYLLYANFPNYMGMWGGDYLHYFAAYFPGYALLLPIIIETIWLSVVSLFFYHKFMEFKSNGKNIQKNLILLAASVFYLTYGSFIEDPVSMIPHFLSRLSGLVLYLALIKYFWKNNPLSHVFGTLMYLQSYKIIHFIQQADPTIKIQGWVVGGLFVLLFIYSVRLESFRKIFSSRTA